MADPCLSLTNLEVSMAVMFDVFMSYRNADGKLDKETFSKVLKEELPFFAEQAAADPDCDIFSKVDVNNDGSVDFQEFSSLLFIYACANYEVLEKVLQKKKEDEELNKAN